MPDHLVLCGGVSSYRPGDQNVIRLNTSGPAANIKPLLHDLSRHFVKDVPPLFADLLEVASYVYAADGSITRGGDLLQGMGKHWRRKLNFVIPVRRLDVWQTPEVVSALADVLGFLSDDDYVFEFTAHDDPAEFASYLDLESDTATGFDPDDVILFSGGLDSLAGAVEQVIGNGRKALLVSHHSSPKTFSRQKELVTALQEISPGRVMHLPVKVQNSNHRVSEFTLRSRSFLFASLAAIAAKMTGTDTIHFFENGIVSLNLPIAAQVVGGRATRTTHPRTLDGFSIFFSTLFGDDFAVVNPFFWKTKAEVATVMGQRECQDLIRGSVSCSHVRAMTRYRNHCGVCSQCIDRRFGTLGAGLEDFDTDDAYEVRLLQDARETPRERNLAALYVKSALETSVSSDDTFYEKFASEISQALRALPGPQDDTSKRIIDLYRRHSMGVRQVLEEGIKSFADDFLTGTLPATSLLKIVTGPDGSIDLPEAQNQETADITIEQNVDANLTLPSKVRIAVDEDCKHVLFDNLPPLSGDKTCRLFQCLVNERLKDLANGKAPENYNSLKAATLADQIPSDEEGVRKQISRIRSNFANNYLDRYGMPATESALIETVHWHGYRLNPNVLILAPGEIRGS